MTTPASSGLWSELALLAGFTVIYALRRDGWVTARAVLLALALTAEDVEVALQ